MKNIFTFVIIVMALAACAAPLTQAAPEPAATGMPQAGILPEVPSTRQPLHEHG